MRKHRALGTKMVLAGFDAGKSDHRPVSGPSGGEKGEDLESEVAAAARLTCKERFIPRRLSPFLWLLAAQWRLQLSLEVQVPSLAWFTCLAFWAEGPVAMELA